jgi:hypothetical protein
MPAIAFKIAWHGLDPIGGKGGHRIEHTLDAVCAIGLYIRWSLLKLVVCTGLHAESIKCPPIGKRKSSVSFEYVSTMQPVRRIGHV